MNLLTRNNPKSLKGEKHGYISWLLHLAPYTLSGKNVCPASSPGCRKACLNTAGRGGMVKTGEKTNRIQECRIRRTKLFNENRQEFFHQLINDIYAGIAYAEKRKMTPCFRLNATSDIEWEKLEAMPGINIFDLFPNVIFYDYTKIPNRKSPANYHLTFSRSEDNMIFVFDAILAKQNVAVVFHTVPEVWNNRKVVNGDETDLRFLDPRGVFVGLKAKGKAKTDKTGFVI